MADKKRKKSNSFRNASYENKLSKVVKSIEAWVIDVLKSEKNDKVFIDNCVTQIISEIYGILRRQFFEQNTHTLTTLIKDPCLV